jgi:hypothetical protein
VNADQELRRLRAEGGAVPARSSFAADEGFADEDQDPLDIIRRHKAGLKQQKKEEKKARKSEKKQLKKEKKKAKKTAKKAKKAAKRGPAASDSASGSGSGSDSDLSHAEGGEGAQI